MKKSVMFIGNLKEDWRQKFRSFAKDIQFATKRRDRIVAKLIYKTISENQPIL